MEVTNHLNYFLKAVMVLVSGIFTIQCFLLVLIQTEINLGSIYSYRVMEIVIVIEKGCVT